MGVTERYSIRESIKAHLFNYPSTYHLAKIVDLTLRYGRRKVHDPDYEIFANFAELPGVFVDVGANAGQSALSFAAVNRTMKIVSFEPNKALEVDLKLVQRLLGRRFEYRMCGLGEVEGHLDFFVPRIRRTLLTQEGTFSRAELESEATAARIPHPFVIERLSLDVLAFDDLRIAPSLVKIDVQGYEEQVISGMMGSISRDHPILMIERCSDDAMFDRIAHRLVDYGYGLFRYESGQNRLLPLPRPSGLNYFAVPITSQNPLAAVARRIIG
jgi:FkbM family methyltransferase